ncbi:MAG TPA: Asp-tRNA(Asn)/Glu-tRNA(Gln) amidotransferase GatCAB subunit B, partial [Candidatus Nitrosotenuis sp.]|nr:Asp-tRNA(Asn)/Glu-tRNA(Gln) amidotransferase GatCAB subunit B [Candidatus Nitrosotenuis sp.]
ELVSAISAGKITKSSAKNALQEIVKTGKSVSDIISSTGMAKISD